MIRPSAAPITLLATLLLATGPRAARADDACLKVVFGSWCLGGPAPVEVARREPDANAVDAGDDVWLGLEKGRISAVTRRLRPATWVAFTRWKAQLSRIYGREEDTSDFPRSATSSSSRLNAIRAGRGEAGARWRQDGWAVELQWRNTRYLELVYRLDEAGPPALDPDTL